MRENKCQSLLFLFGNHLLKAFKEERWLQPILKTFDKLTPCNLQHKDGLYHMEVDKNNHFVFLVIESGKLDAKLQPIMLKQQILENQNQELTQLRDWLLPMLMNGQVKVE